jgi:hypothetical protein
MPKWAKDFKMSEAEKNTQDVEATETAAKPRKAPVQNPLSDQELLDVMNRIADKQGGIADIVEETGYSKASINGRRNEITKALRKALEDADKTEDEIAVMLPQMIKPLKRGGGGGGKKTRDTAGMVAAVLAQFAEAE